MEKQREKLQERIINDKMKPQQQLKDLLTVGYSKEEENISIGETT